MVKRALRRNPWIFSSHSAVKCTKSRFLKYTWLVLLVLFYTEMKQKENVGEKSSTEVTFSIRNSIWRVIQRSLCFSFSFQWPLPNILEATTLIACGNKMPTRCNRVFLIADLIACSVCSGHHYAHYQGLKSIIQWLLPVVFRAVVFKLLVWCGAEGYVSGLQDAAASCKPDT